EDGKNYQDWTDVKGTGKSIAVTTDIYTRNISGCKKNGVLHLATGQANNIYVVVEYQGLLYLTKGAVFSFYEFVEPPQSRLTDQQWQQRIKEGHLPQIPTWMKDLIIKGTKEPKVNEKISYSSGC
ncbi:MAG: DUF3160 domain-containing protein, partial [Bacteroidota bacterium]|nr:DUF3160 domain-containing protein [Bacteroidota bacterium]